jgi:hypothetical protein
MLFTLPPSSDSVLTDWGIDAYVHLSLDVGQDRIQPDVWVDFPNPASFRA